MLYQSVELEHIYKTPEGTQICPNGGWLKGTCNHHNVRWLHLSCKRRDCPYCNALRKRRIAHRIEYGLQLMGRAAWFVGTWDYDVPKWYAVLTQQHFIQWLRRDMHMPVEYTAVWEEHRSGRLHLNLLLANWYWIDQATLSKKWEDFGGGKVVWIEEIKDGISYEVLKLRKKLSNYMAKFEQQVRTGKGITYSRGWPKLPPHYSPRKGFIRWRWLSKDTFDAQDFENKLIHGVYQEIRPAEFQRTFQSEACDCFDFEVNIEKGGMPLCEEEEADHEADGHSEEAALSSEKAEVDAAAVTASFNQLKPLIIKSYFNRRERN